MLPIVACITATKGRHSYLERVVACMLSQDYKGKFYNLIYNNHPQSQILSPALPVDKFILVNNSKNLSTGEPYNIVGDVFTDILHYIPEDVEIVNFADDDDLFLPSHISEGVRGMQRGGRTAYKPTYSWFKTKAGIQKAQNTLEPSIFVKRSYLDKTGFHRENVTYHQKWIDTLSEKGDIFVDDGPSTLIYDWSVSVFKISGDPNNPRNFDRHKQYSNDSGDGVISPISQEELEKYTKTNG